MREDKGRSFVVVAPILWPCPAAQWWNTGTVSLSEKQLPSRVIKSTYENCNRRDRAQVRSIFGRVDPVRVKWKPTIVLLLPVNKRERRRTNERTVANSTKQIALMVSYHLCVGVGLCGLSFSSRLPFNATPELVFNKNQTPKTDQPSDQPTTLGLVFRERAKAEEQMDLFVTEKCLLRLCWKTGTDTEMINKTWPFVVPYTPEGKEQENPTGDVRRGAHSIIRDLRSIIPGFRDHTFIETTKKKKIVKIYFKKKLGPSFRLKTGFYTYSDSLTNITLSVTCFFFPQPEKFERGEGQKCSEFKNRVPSDFVFYEAHKIL